MVAGGSTTAYLVAMIIDAERERTRRHQGWTGPQYRTLRSTQDNWFIDWWNTRRESERTILSLIAANGLVFLAWRLPSAHGFMSRYFLHSTRSHPVTMLTSTFSHISGMHFLFNMLALYSFGRMLHEKMGREQFLAFYISCGLLASGGSHFVKSVRGDITSSLGASGAVFGVAAGCAHQPDVRVSLIFLPFVSVPIKFALPAVIIYDTVGLLKRWSTFDHAAHLSGALSGYLLYAVSTRHIWRKRTKILSSLGYPIK
jgi:rhomboid-like protein